MKPVIYALILSALASPVLACEKELKADAHGHVMHTEDKSHHGHSMHQRGDSDRTRAAKMRCNPAVKAYEEANTRMHSDMAITYSGDADLDFVRGMIPHHQGAVDMAQVVMQYGTDPQVRRLAADIIRSQNREIAWMKKYAAQIEKRGIKTVTSQTKPRSKLNDITWAGSTWMNER